MLAVTHYNEIKKQYKEMFSLTFSNNNILCWKSLQWRKKLIQVYEITFELFIFSQRQSGSPRDRVSVTPRQFIMG